LPCSYLAITKIGESLCGHRTLWSEIGLFER
jgi:hypothetical protein